jgi:hypothetical protein
MAATPRRMMTRLTRAHIAAALLFAALLAPACEETTEPLDEGYRIVGVVSGELPTTESEAVASQRFAVDGRVGETYAASTIGPDGSFELTGLYDPSEAATFPAEDIARLLGEFDESVTVEPETARFCWIRISVVEKATGRTLGALERASAFPADSIDGPDDFRVEYLYASEAADVSGRASAGADETVYRLRLAPGWNEVAVYPAADDPLDSGRRVEYDSDLPPDKSTAWRIDFFSGEL